MSTPISTVGSAPSIPTFNFGSNLPSITPAATSKVPTFAPFPAISTPLTTKLPDFGAPSKMTETAATGESAKMETDPVASSYLEELKALNGCVVVWMRDNFLENPHVDFTPVFDDYKKHFKELEDKYRGKAAISFARATNGGNESISAPAGGAPASFGFNGSPLVSVMSKTPSIAGMPFYQ